MLSSEIIAEYKGIGDNAFVEWISPVSLQELKNYNRHLLKSELPVLENKQDNSKNTHTIHQVVLCW